MRMQVYVCVLGVNLGPRGEGGGEKALAQEMMHPLGVKRQQGGGLLLQGSQIWSIMFIKSDDEGLARFFFVRLKQ